MSYLLEPLQAGSLLLTNRLVMPPMATENTEPNGRISQALLDYYDEKSKGGYHFEFPFSSSGTGTGI